MNKNILRVLSGEPEPEPKKKYAHIVSVLNIIRCIVALCLMFYFLDPWAVVGIWLLYSFSFK